MPHQKGDVALLIEPPAGVGSLVLVGEDAESTPGHHEHGGTTRGRLRPREVVDDQPRIRDVRPSGDAVGLFLHRLGGLGGHPRLGHPVGPQHDLPRLGGTATLDSYRDQRTDRDHHDRVTDRTRMHKSGIQREKRRPHQRTSGCASSGRCPRPNSVSRRLNLLKSTACSAQGPAGGLKVRVALDGLVKSALSGLEPRFRRGDRA